MTSSPHGLYKLEQNYILFFGLPRCFSSLSCLYLAYRFIKSWKVSTFGAMWIRNIIYNLIFKSIIISPIPRTFYAYKFSNKLFLQLCFRNWTMNLIIARADARQRRIVLDYWISGTIFSSLWHGLSQRYNFLCT